MIMAKHGLERIETLGPVLPVGLQPRVELEERLSAQCIQPALGIPAYGDQPGVLQHSQVLRRLRLAEPKSVPDFTNRARPVA